MKEFILYNEEKQLKVKLKQRITGKLKDELQGILKDLKPDPRNELQQKILEGIKVDATAENPEKSAKVGMKEALKLKALQEKPYSDTEYTIIKHNDKIYIDAFIACVENADVHSELFDDSEFWADQDINELTEVVEFFRRKAKL